MDSADGGAVPGRRGSSKSEAGRASLGELDAGLFRLHFDNLPGPAYIWQRQAGEDFRLIAHNKAGAEVGRSKVGPFIGAVATELYADKPELLEDLRQCSARAVVIRREIDFHFSTGAVRRLVGTCVPLSRDTVVIHVEDVTAQRAAARALQESEERWRALFESNPDVVFRMNADARVLDLHVPEANELSWDSERMIGRSVADYYGEEARKLQARYNREAIRTGQAQVFEYKIPAGDTVMTLESRVVRAGEDEVVVSVRDVSDRVELEKKLTILRERERNRIGRDIHDGLAQMLTGVKLLMENLERRLLAEGSRHVGDATRATALINDTIAQARELVRGLSPIPEGATLFDGLNLLARQSARYLGVTCRTKLVGDAQGVGEAAIAHLYRIAQEAITNAVKHGNATSIDLTCSVADGELVLTISDDGTGMPDALAESEGVGLRTMRHRARAMGGELSVSRRAAGGTVVTCTCLMTALT